jgi:hypothetical protein
MDFVKKEALSNISFESLFDEKSATVDKELFKDDIVVAAKSMGQSVEIDRTGKTGDDLVIKVLDPHKSMMYNVFNSDDDYKKWVRQSLHEPTEDEIMQSLRSNG